MKTKLINGKQCVRRESVVGNVEEFQFWTGTPNYTAQIIRLIDQCIETGETIREAFTWRYTNRVMSEWIYGKPTQTQDTARTAYYEWSTAE
jgi:hypothetical protein